MQRCSDPALTSDSARLQVNDNQQLGVGKFRIGTAFNSHFPALVGQGSEWIVSVSICLSINDIWFTKLFDWWHVLVELLSVGNFDFPLRGSQSGFVLSSTPMTVHLSTCRFHTVSMVCGLYFKRQVNVFRKWLVILFCAKSFSRKLIHQDMDSQQGEPFCFVEKTITYPKLVSFTKPMWDNPKDIDIDIEIHWYNAILIYSRHSNTHPHMHRLRHCKAYIHIDTNTDTKHSYT